MGPDDDDDGLDPDKGDYSFAPILGILAVVVIAVFTMSLCAA